MSRTQWRDPEFRRRYYLANREWIRAQQLAYQRSRRGFIDDLIDFFAQTKSARAPSRRTESIA